MKECRERLIGFGENEGEHLFCERLRDTTILSGRGCAIREGPALRDNSLRANRCSPERSEVFPKAYRRNIFCNNKKSQMEIMGLAIVVILLVVGMTFVIRFMINKEPVDYKKQFSQAETASNTLNTFLKATSRACNGLTMTELLQDCGHTKNIICPNGQNSCVYLELAAKEILNKTLDSWNFEYEFSAYQDEAFPLVKLGKRCPAEKKSKTFPIPTSSGTIFTKLDVCG